MAGRRSPSPPHPSFIIRGLHSSMRVSDRCVPPFTHPAVSQTGINLPPELLSSPHPSITTFPAERGTPPPHVCLLFLCSCLLGLPPFIPPCLLFPDIVCESRSVGICVQTPPHPPSGFAPIQPSTRLHLFCSGSALRINSWGTRRPSDLRHRTN